MSAIFRVRDIRQIARMANFKVTVNDQCCQASIKLPGFTMDDFDRDGQICGYRMQRLLTVCRMFAYKTAPSINPNFSFLRYKELKENYYTFMVSIKTTISPKLYTLPQESHDYQLSVNLRLGHIGSSSISTLASLMNDVTGEELVHNVNQVVVVDKLTRKATPVPDWWREQFENLTETKEKLLVKPFPLQTVNHKLDINVPWADMDDQNHTNFNAYLCYCKEGYTDALKAGAYANFSESADTLRQIKSFQLLFRGESSPKDHLSVHTWQDNEASNILYFDVHKSEKSIFQNKLEYY